MPHFHSPSFNFETTRARLLALSPRTSIEHMCPSLRGSDTHHCRPRHCRFLVLGVFVAWVECWGSRKTDPPLSPAAPSPQEWELLQNRADKFRESGPRDVELTISHSGVPAGSIVFKAQIGRKVTLAAASEKLVSIAEQTARQSPAFMCPAKGNMEAIDPSLLHGQPILLHILIKKISGTFDPENHGRPWIGKTA